jgi:hypothetical protein
MSVLPMPRLRWLGETETWWMCLPALGTKRVEGTGIDPFVAPDIGDCPLVVRRDEDDVAGLRQGVLKEPGRGFGIKDRTKDFGIRFGMQRLHVLHEFAKRWDVASMRGPDDQNMKYLWAIGSTSAGAQVRSSPSAWTS